MRNHKGQFVKGNSHPKEVREKIRLSKIGAKNPRYGKAGTRTGDKASLETRKRLSESHLGHKHSAETRKKLSQSHKGKVGYWVGKKRPPFSEETRRRMSIAMSRERPGSSREKNPRWKGGITPINKAIRSSREYKLWRIAVFERDNFTCVWCGNNESGNLNADHIKPFALFPELRFAIDNGRTLCVPCHKTTDSYLKRNPTKA